MQSPLASSYSSTSTSSTDHGSSPPADRVSPDAAAIPETGEPRSKGEDTSQLNELQVLKEEPPNNSKGASELVRLANKQRKAYKRWIERETRDATQVPKTDEYALSTSYIGQSCWAGTEKVAFFDALSKYGRDDLANLQRVIGTKSLPEIRQYVHLLREQSLDVDECPLEDLPAAFEIDDFSESALGQAADSAAKRALDDEVSAEQKRYDGIWLIDEDVAAELELQYQASSAAEHEGLDTGSKSRDDNDEADTSPGNSLDIFQDMPSAELLVPEVLLQMSRSLFMNAHGQGNWRTMEDRVDEDITTSPAMFRSAFDELCGLCVAVARRLVQAALFQAMSRVRGDEEARTNAVVMEKDVRTAVDLLSISPDRSKFWATAPRRCGLEVYSEAKKYYDGRTTTKNGVRLTLAEVESELGEGQPPASKPIVGGGGGDLQLDASAASSIKSSSDYETDMDIDSDRDEDARLEVLDQKASTAERGRLSKVFRFKQPQLENPPMPELEQAKRKRGHQNDNHDRSYPDWRKRTRYEAEWEQAGARFQTG